MPISNLDFETRGVDACKWFVYRKGIQLPNLVFGSRIEAEFWVNAKIEYWNKVKEAASDMVDICDGSGEMSVYDE